MDSTNEEQSHHKLRPNIVARDALKTVVVMHPRLPALISDFLSYKRTDGSAIEQNLYKDMSEHDLVARLIKQRPLHFVQSHDYTVLRNGPGFMAHDEWLRVGTALEGRNQHIHLADYLSYDEMMLSSLLGTSGPFFFINRGSRTNCAEPGKKDSHQDRGIIVGLVGARFDQPGHMDAAIMLLPMQCNKQYPRKQNSVITKMFQDFFGGKKENVSFNVALYKARMRVSIDTLLLEADDRAAQAGTTAYVHLVGLGLGV